MDAEQNKARAKVIGEKLAKHLVPGSKDSTLLVLKAHLLYEEVLYAFIKGHCTNPQFIDKARLGFEKKLCIARALHKKGGSDWWVWEALSKLNALRNGMAHNLEPRDVKSRFGPRSPSLNYRSETRANIVWKHVPTTS